MINQVGQPGTLSSAVDGYTSGVVGLFEISALPHIAFRRNYLSQLHTLLPLQVAQPGDEVVSPDSSGSGSLHPAESPEVVEKSPRTTRRAYRRRRPVRVMESSVENLPVLTIQDPSPAAGAVVFAVGLHCYQCLWT